MVHFVSMSVSRNSSYADDEEFFSLLPGGNAAEVLSADLNFFYCVNQLKLQKSIYLVKFCIGFLGIQKTYNSSVCSPTWQQIVAGFGGKPDQYNLKLNYLYISYFLLVR